VEDVVKLCVTSDSTKSMNIFLIVTQHIDIQNKHLDNLPY